MEDKDIIELYRSGQEERAFALIVKNYSEKLYWHVRRFTVSHEDADDILQDVFIKVWAALPSFREESRLFTWLYRIATNEALNWNRKAHVKAAMQFESLGKQLDDRIDSDPYFNGDELQRELQKAINRLPARQKEVFMLRYFDELPYEDISEILGTSTSSLKASYHHAYEKIKDALKKHF